MMNIKNRFKSQCVVDWLDLEVRTSTATPGWRIRREGAGTFSYVTGLDPETGEDIFKTGAQGKSTPTTRFSLRIQNPDRFTSVNDALTQSGIMDRIDQNAEILVTGIEVSFDLYALSGTDERDLIEMATILATSVNHVSNKLPRAYRRKRETHYPTLKSEFYAALKSGFMFGFGDKDDELYQRTYFKTTDNKETLPEKAHRARIEIRLQGNACPIRTLADLKEFDFANLAKFFKFRQPDPDVSGIMALMIDRRVSKGGVLDERGQLTEAFRIRGRKRKTALNTTASPLNEIARDKLRKLTCRWQAKTGSGRARKPPIICASYGFSGVSSPLQPVHKTSRQDLRKRLETQANTGVVGSTSAYQ